MTERVIRSCGQQPEDYEEPVFTPDPNRLADYQSAATAAETSADHGRGSEAQAFATLALAAQLARIADVIEFLAVSNSL